jgi:hypothetical protein
MRAASLFSILIPGRRDSIEPGMTSKKRTLSYLSRSTIKA